MPSTPGCAWMATILGSNSNNNGFGGCSVRILALATTLLLGHAASSWAQTSVAQDARQIESKMVCSAHSSNPEKQPAFQVVVPFTLSHGLLTAERELASDRGKESFKGVVGHSGDILLIGEGSNTNGIGSWVYEFHGKFSAKGTSVLKGGLQSTIGAIGSRTCTISF